MIKANELRIGNWVSNIKTEDFSQFFASVISIEKDCVQISRNPDDEAGMNVFLDDVHGIEPISLTPEILENCGFVCTSTQLNYFRKYLNEGSKADSCLVKMEFGDLGVTAWVAFVNRWTMNEFYVRVKYLHQLQNLYFTLTGEELEINETTFPVKQ